MRHYLATDSQARAAYWLRLFGTDRLPVLCAHWRWQEVDGSDCPAYDLDLSALHQGQRDRLAGYVAKRTARPYSLVKKEIDNAFTWPVRASGCYVVEDEQETAIRPSLLLPAVWHVFGHKHGRLAHVV